MASKKFARDVDIRVEYLVSGYIRLIGIVNQIIPSSTVKLCILFYHSSLQIIYIEARYEYKVPNIIISHLDKGTHNKCLIKPLKYESLDEMVDITNNKKERTHKMDNGAGICYVKDFELPQSVISLNDKLYHKHSYNVIFVAGSSQRCRGYIMDTTHCHENDDIDGYYWDLPQMTQPIDGTTLVYSQKYGLISIGSKRINASFNILNFNEENEWKENKMERRRTHTAASMINENKIICCGGWTNDEVKFVDIYDFEDKKWIERADLITRRNSAGIFVDKFVNERVYIAGGVYPSKKVEFYDIIKNEWVPLNDTNKSHQFWPVIWSENINIIHIASPSGAAFEKMDLRENKWNIYTQPFDELFGAPIVTDHVARFCKSMILNKL